MSRLLRLRYAASHFTKARATSPATSAAQQSSELRNPVHLFRRNRSTVLRMTQEMSKQHGGQVSLANVILQMQVPKGFENFVPKNSRGSNKKDQRDGRASSDKGASKAGNDASGKKDEKAKKEPEKATKKSGSPFGNFGQQQKGGGGSQNPQQPPMPSLMASFLLLLLVYGFLQFDDEEGSSDLGSREITWSDFRNYLLENGEVEKILITNKNTTARVFLKPGAQGVPLHAARHGPKQLVSASSSSGGRKQKHSDERAGTHDFDDQTTMEMGTGSEKQSSGLLGGPLLKVGVPFQQNQLVYRFAIGSVESFEKKLDAAQAEMGIETRDHVPVQYASDSTVATELLSIVPSLLLIGVMVAMFRGMGSGAGGGGGGMGNIFKVGKSNAKKINKEDVSVTFKDVAGCQEAKKEIMEFVDFLQDSSRFTKLGAKIPKGALLCGPPGTGKTLLAKAVAGEANVPFFSISGSDFIEMFVGVGPSRVRDLFKEARSNAPCIIFIDEIDAVGRKRGQGGVGGNDERENTLNQLLVEMDGFTPSSGVVVLAGTNRADILDQALTRPGRFDRQIQVDKPDLQGRKEIFLVHLQDIKLDSPAEDVAGRLAGLTPGFAGADIANICNEAAIVAARRAADAVTMDDFEKATDRIVGGLESNKIMSKEERSLVAHHEAGHAVAGWFLEHADPLLKVTIIPRSSGALGYAQYLPREVFLRTQEQIMDIVSMALAGRAAEEIFFGRVTTGASDDLRRVTDLIYSTIQLYGMNARVGQLAFPKDPNALWDERPYSNKTAEAMDEEARTIVEAAYQRTLDLIKEKKVEVEKVANLLLEKETITHDDMIDVIGARPFEGDAAYKEFVRRRRDDKDAKVKADEPEQNGNDEDRTPDAGTGGLSPGLA